MSPEAQRITIAEACGWKLEGGTTLSGVPYKVWIKGVPTSKSSAQAAYQVDELPDYLNDLNACHEMESNLLNEQRRAYVELLIAVHPLHYDFRTHDDSRMAAYMIVTATAEQRAKAYLMALGLWKT